MNREHISEGVPSRPKVKCRQCQDTGRVAGASADEFCICVFGARLLHAAKYPNVKRCENCNCAVPPCSYALQAAKMVAPYKPEPHAANVPPARLSERFASWFSRAVGL